MECELCGRGTRLVKAEIEGTLLSVCSSCARFGKIREVKTEIIRENKPITVQVSTIDPNFAKIVKNNRMFLNMNVRELGDKISEKAFVIDRVERGMRPTDTLARKLENALNVKLLGYQEVSVSVEKVRETEVNIGDVAVIKNRNK